MEPSDWSIASRHGRRKRERKREGEKEREHVW